MFFNKKESDGLPDLPLIKTPFSIDTRMSHGSEEIEESHALPSFLDSPTQNGFSQVAIRDAMGQGGEELPEIPGERKDIKVVEMQEWNPTTIPESEEPSEKIAPLPEPVDPGKEKIRPPPKLGLGERILPPPYPINAGNMDVFVKLDKFHSAKKTLGEVRDKLEEVDNLVKKIREIKLREEQEIASWERDLTFAKSRIQEITENIFEKVG